MVTLNEEPTAVTGESAGYPSMQAVIDEALDAALHIVADVSARSAIADPRYATLAEVLRQARDADLATARALDLPSPAEATEEELRQIEALLEANPELDAEFAPLVRDLEAKLKAIPPVEVKVQEFDKDDRPVGNPQTIKSVGGVIDFSHDVLTSTEFLLAVQAERDGPGRGFVMGPYYMDGPSQARKWPNAKVYFFFDRTVPPATQSWMRGSMGRMKTATGMKFREGTWLWWHEFWWNLGSSNYVRISIGNVDGGDGQASVGKHGQSFLRVEQEDSTDEYVFNHEMGHVFGLLHEHQRDDRDSYIHVGRTGSAYDKVDLEIEWCWYFLWWKKCRMKGHAATYDTPFDYHSVMHYPSTSKTKITYKSDNESHDGKCWRVHTLNGNTFFTPWDIYAVKRLYANSPNRKPEKRPAVDDDDIIDCE